MSKADPRYIAGFFGRDLSCADSVHEAGDDAVFCDANCHQDFCIHGGDEYPEEDYEEGLLP